MRALPTGTFEPCEVRAARVSSTALVRYRTNDYSVPTRYGFQDVVVQASYQDPDRAAVGRNRGHAVLGADGIRPDRDAKDRRLVDAADQAARPAD